MTNELLWKKEWHTLNKNDQNKPKMAQTLKFLIALKFNSKGVNFINNQNLVIPKSGKIIKFEVENLILKICI